MINDIYQSIAEDLRNVCDCPIYAEQSLQNFQTPCYIVTIYDMDAATGINKRKKTELGIDVLYFPRSKTDDGAKTECWEMAEKLNRGLIVRNFRLKDRTATVEDNTLHYMFKIPYREYKQEPANLMQGMTQNTELEE